MIQTHNFFFLLCQSAYGLFTHSSGPHLGRGTDRTAFRESNIYHYYHECLQNEGMNPAEFAMLGDKIFVNRPPAFISLLRAPLPGDEEDFQQVDSVCRTAIEWGNGKVTENWKYLTYPYKLKVNLSAVGQDMVVGLILTNALSLCHGNQTANFFQDPQNPLNLEMPTLEEYFEFNN